MALHACDVDFHVGRSAVIQSGSRFSHTALLDGTTMHADEDFNIVNSTAFQHGKSAFTRFLRRLEKKFQFPFPDQLLFHDFFRRREKHGHVSVMPAKVGGAAVFRPKSIHVRAKAENRSRFTAVTDRDDACRPADLCFYFITELFQHIRHVSGSFKFFHPYFRNGMKIVKMGKYICHDFLLFS